MLETLIENWRPAPATYETLLSRPTIGIGIGIIAIATTVLNSISQQPSQNPKTNLKNSIVKTPQKQKEIKNIIHHPENIQCNPTHKESKKSLIIEKTHKSRTTKQSFKRFEWKDALLHNKHRFNNGVAVIKQGESYRKLIVFCKWYKRFQTWIPYYEVMSNGKKISFTKFDRDSIDRGLVSGYRNIINVLKSLKNTHKIKSSTNN